MQPCVHIPRAGFKDLNLSQAFDKLGKDFAVAAKALANVKRHIKYTRTSLDAVESFGTKLFGEIPEKAVKECTAATMSALCAIPPDPAAAVGVIRDTAVKHAKPAGETIKQLLSGLRDELPKLLARVFPEGTPEVTKAVSEEVLLEAAHHMSQVEASNLQILSFFFFFFFFKFKFTQGRSTNI